MRFARDGLSTPVNLVVEILIFTLVFLVVGIVFEGVLLVLGMLPLLLTNESFLDAMGTTAAQGKVLVDAATTAKIAD
ncbi:MAG: hypothetical protein LBU31_00505, partial [Coriobacteriales bacterium]|nr:hypothetical protein [Coriobacteriales bacterium]